MKVCIVTVYNSINSGSYWQAKALEKKIKELGHEVSFLERKNDIVSSSSKISLMKRMFKHWIKYGFNEAKKQLEIVKEFKDLQKDFIITKNKKNELSQVDCFVLGSDTIWNIESKFFKKNYKTFFGDFETNGKVFSYAASVGNTKLETLQKYKDIPEMIERLTEVLVRDQETYDIVKKISKKTPKLVCDPTLLLSKQEYKLMENKRHNKNKYIFLYLFEDLKQEHIEQLTIFAKKNNLEIISGTKFLKYADKSIVNAPDTFLNHILYAEYVITDTFHGTIFSINLEKEFIVIDRNKKKVLDAIKRFNLLERKVQPNDNIIEKLTSKIQYKDVSRRVTEFREESKNLLEKNIR